MEMKDSSVIAKQRDASNRSRRDSNSSARLAMQSSKSIPVLRRSKWRAWDMDTFEEDTWERCIKRMTMANALRSLV